MTTAHPRRAPLVAPADGSWRPGRHLGQPLEWGQQSDEPGSRVVDVEGRMVFTGSRVTPARVADWEARGEGDVCELGEGDDGTTVRVRWARGGETVELSRKVQRVR